VAGDLKKPNKMDRKYFGPIEKASTKKANVYRETDNKRLKRLPRPNIQIPMVVASYRTPSMKKERLEF
jgi:hypothetical protein